MEIKFCVGDRVNVNVSKEIKERVDCDTCDGCGTVNIKNKSFTCPNCGGKKWVYMMINKVFVETKVITSITIGKTGIKYQAKDVDGGNSRNHLEDEIIGLAQEE